MNQNIEGGLEPSKSLIALDLLHNIFFDIIAEEKGYTKGDFEKQ